MNCKYCDRAVETDSPIEDMCGTCLDVEFCCNVAKELYGTKALARLVAQERGMSEALAYFDEVRHGRIVS